MTGPASFVIQVVEGDFDRRNSRVIDDVDSVDLEARIVLSAHLPGPSRDRCPGSLAVWGGMCGQPFEMQEEENEDDDGADDGEQGFAHDTLVSHAGAGVSGVCATAHSRLG